MLRVHCVRVGAMPFRRESWIDDTALEEGEQAVYAWLLAARFTEERALSLARRFDRRYPDHQARVLVRDLTHAVAS